MSTRRATITLWPGKALRMSPVSRLGKRHTISLTWFLAVCINSSSPQRLLMEPRLIPRRFLTAQVWWQRSSIFLTLWSSYWNFYLTTDASPVSWLQCNSPNTPDATLLVSWTSPRGRYNTFEVNVNDDKINRSISPCCSHNVSNLQHHTVYHLTVRTQSCGRPSISVSQQCRTGITSRTLNIPNDQFFSSFRSLFVSLICFSSKIHQVSRAMRSWCRWARRQTKISPSRLTLVCWTTPMGRSLMLVCWWPMIPLVRFYPSLF